MPVGQVRAIVFDANVFGHSVEPNVQTIETWADACARHDAELWIPEVVVWELAERVVSAAAEFAETVQAHNRRRLRWGFEPVDEPDVVVVDDVVLVIEEAGARVVELTDEAARAAIRDQVLVVGTGGRKSGVKTGAADSAWLRSVVAQNGGNLDQIILVTGDVAAVQAVGDELGVRALRHASHLGELRALLDELAPADTRQIAVFKDTVQAEVVGTKASSTELLDLGGVDRFNWWSPDLAAEFLFSWEHQDSSVTLNPALQFSGNLTFDAWSDSISGQVRFLVSVEDQYARQDSLGDAPEYCAVTYEAWLDSNITVYLSQDADQRPAIIGDFLVNALGVDQSSVREYSLS